MRHPSPLKVKKATGSPIAHVNYSTSLVYQQLVSFLSSLYKAYIQILSNPKESLNY